MKHVGEVENPPYFTRRGRDELTTLIHYCARDHVTRTISLCILLVNIFFMIAFFASSSMRESHELARMIYLEIDLGNDHSLSEIFNHGVSFFTAMLFLMTFMDKKSRASVFLALLAIFIWFDDAAQYHEKVGSLLSAHFEFQPRVGLRAQDVGEIAAWFIAAVLLLTVLTWSLLDRKKGDVGLLFGAGSCFAALVVFGVFFDMVHIIYPTPLFTLIEDGGETIALAGFCALAIGVYRNSDRYFSTTRSL